MTTKHVTVGRWLAALLVCIATSIIPFNPPYASDQNRDADVACVVVGLRMTQMSDPQQRSAGLMLAAYYLGRIDGRASDAEVERLIEREAEKMSGAEFRENAVRCGKALTTKGQEIQKISEDLSRKAQGEATEK